MLTLALILLTALLSKMSPALAASAVPLLGEEEIQDVDAYSSKLEQEAMGFLDSPTSDWDMVGSYERGLQIYSRPVKDNTVSSHSASQISSIKMLHNINAMQ